MRVAYADPPYPGCASYYVERTEVDLGMLVTRLKNEFPDGWALSTSSPMLYTALSACPDDVRVMAWVKTFCSFKPNINPAYAWEPLLVRGGRRRTRAHETVRDWCATPITLKRGLVGAKPDAFCRWLFDVMGLEASDELVDLFPG